MSYKGSQVANNGSCGSEQAEYEDSEWGSCLPFGLSEGLESHGGSQMCDDKHCPMDHEYAESNQTHEKAGHLWDYWSPEVNSSDEQSEYERSGWDSKSSEHKDYNHEDLEGEE